VYPSQSFDPKAVVDTIIGDQCTALHGVPTHFLGVLSEVDKRQADGKTLDLSNLRWGLALSVMSCDHTVHMLERGLLQDPLFPST
jgi:hypothetical protein